MHLRPFSSAARGPRPSAWLASLYVLAALFAPYAHDHGHPNAAPKALEACDAPGAHWGAHTDTPELDHAPDDCTACLFRAQHVVAPITASLHSQAATTHRIELPAPLVRRLTPRAISSRGPPRV